VEDQPPQYDEQSADRARGERRRLPLGAEYYPPQGTHFRVWAPKARSVEVVLAQGAWPLQMRPGGYHAGWVAQARAGMRYQFRLDGGVLLPDPASRYQPEGPHGPSEIVDPQAFDWTDATWPGVSAEGQVLYELHIGTFTPEGSYDSAAEHLPYLKELGITTLELMPVNEFDGPFGWGYDGVNLFAPTRLYGRPDDLRRFVNRAHELGLGVILDVVYNHFGPSGNYLSHFSSSYVTSRYKNEWGDAINFDGKGSASVREFFVTNAAYWIDEFHFDGLRLDATQCLFDNGPRHVVADIVAAARRAAGNRRLFIYAENEPQHARLIRAPEQGGFGCDAVGNEDFHHSAFAAATGCSEAYFSETRGAPQELISALKWGFLYQGQWYAWQQQRRGAPALDLPARAFVLFLQNHDQVANNLQGHRLHQLTSPGRLRALTALLLLAPGTPLLFQGQEFAASAPFVFFARHGAELDRLVTRGRGEFLRQFPNAADPAAQAVLPIPSDPESFLRCKLDHSERQRNAGVVALHRDLLRLRREDPVFAAQDSTRLHGAVLGAEALALRFFGANGDDRLLLLNLGTSLPPLPLPEPLLAPPEGQRWRMCWHSEAPAYGGNGMGELEGEHRWRLPGHALAVLASSPQKESDHA